MNKYNIYDLDKEIVKADFKIDKVQSSINYPDGSFILPQKKDIQKRISQLKKYKKQLVKLLKIPKIEQKTDEWYKVRQNLVTASDFAQALGLGKFGTTKQFYQKKCEVASADSAAAGKTNPFFKWGNMFEDVALSIYSDMLNIKLYEFGLLQHPKHNFAGASPDSISDNGIMVEIKCPKKRQIVDGEVPTQYYYQIQGQLDVCELDECDYFECEFGLYDVLDDFLNNLDEYKYRGILIELEDESFKYSGVTNNKYELIDFINQTNGIASKKYLWYLNAFNLKRVYKDENFLKENMKKLEDVWNKVLIYRNDYEKYKVEVLNSIDIQTERLYKKIEKDIKDIKDIPKLKGWSFIEDE
jgi:putative phage-type endonuclease